VAAELRTGQGGRGSAPAILKIIFCKTIFRQLHSAVLSGLESPVMPATFELLADADDQQLLAQVVAYYQRSLQASAQALDYLAKLGLGDGQALEQFRIGYADRTLGLKLPSKEVKAGKEIRARLQQIGLFRASGHEHFNGCVVFPILAGDGTGRILDIHGRKILGKRLKKRCPLELHLGDQRRGVWNVAAFAATEEIILCPALFDALAFWSHGYRHVTCMFGPDALTADLLAAFAEFNIKRVITPCQAVCSRLLQAGLDCYLLKLPADLDVSGYARQVREPGPALGDLLRHAEWFGNGVHPAAPALPSPPQAATPPASVPVPQPQPAAAPGPSASPLPPAPADRAVALKEDEALLTFGEGEGEGERRYRVRGWSKSLSFDSLRVNVMASAPRGLFVDTFDLYSAKHRRGFVLQAAAELAVAENTIKQDLGRVLLALEELQDQHLQALTTPRDVQPQMSAEDKLAALRLLRDPQLLDRIVADFQVVGETTNKLAGYLAAVSRKLDQPLAVIIQSSSAAGKTALMEAVLSFVPPEDQVKYSALTGQALFYMGETNLKHKILAIVEEKGAEQASYALKLLQSEGELMIASTAKDGSTGRLTTREYRVEGPVMIFLTTTAIKIDEELLNRCLVLSVNEDREQTRAIHQLQRQRQTLQGLLSGQDHLKTLVLHRNAQRLLRPLLVANPYAEALTFLDDKTRSRRDHVKYLTLIRAVTLLYQYQRPVKTVEHQGKQVEYIEVALEDIDIANRLAHEVLGRSVDDLPPQTRRLLGLIDDMVTATCQRRALARADYRFSRRDVRDYSGWGLTQLQIHLKRLHELEYLLVHRGGRGQSFVYELLYERREHDSQRERFLARLIDVGHLRRDLPGLQAELPAPKRPQTGAKSGPNRPAPGDETPVHSAAASAFYSEVNESASVD
jgi:DNA primase